MDTESTQERQNLYKYRVGSLPVEMSAVNICRPVVTVFQGYGIAIPPGAPH